MYRLLGFLFCLLQYELEWHSRGTALMRRLYQHLVDGADKRSALRQAKLDLLNEFGNEAAPVYRAGFTLTGDGSSPAMP
ncbi:MAG: hypothetical protein DMG13_10195 [Acidobacteria bacterium]|nr:MAG: hypothetical protein DMG13_10195 [Acidobacteriota bacterium]